MMLYEEKGEKTQRWKGGQTRNHEKDEATIGGLKTCYKYCQSQSPVTRI